MVDIDNIKLRDLIYAECKDYIQSNTIKGTYNVSDTTTWTHDIIDFTNGSVIDIDYYGFSIYTSWKGLKTFTYKYPRYGYDLDVSIIRESGYVILHVVVKEPMTYKQTQDVRKYNYILNYEGQ